MNRLTIFMFALPFLFMACEEVDNEKIPAKKNNTDVTNDTIKKQPKVSKHDSIINKEKELLLSKTWVIDSVDPGHHVSKKWKHSYEELIAEAKSHASFEFKKNGTYEAIFHNQVIEVGSWDLNEEETIIFTRRNHDEDKEPDLIHIVELSEEKMALSRKEADDNVITIFFKAKTKE